MRLLLLRTGHPLIFQHQWVRSSTQSYPCFNLPMRSSRSFASTATDNVALFRLGFPVAPVLRTLTGPETVTRRVIMQKARRHPVPEGTLRLRLLVGMWFQILFTPLTEVLFTIRSRYWFTIGRQGVLSLGRWASQIQCGFHVTAPTRVPAGSRLRCRIRDCHPLWSRFSSSSSSRPIGNFHMAGPTTPPGRSPTV